MNLLDFARALVGWTGARPAERERTETDERIVRLTKLADLEAARARRNRDRLAVLRAERRVLTRRRGDAP